MCRIESNGELQMTYSFKKLAEVAKNHVVASGMRGVRIIQKNLKDAATGVEIEKHSYYTELPVLTENFIQAFIANERGFNLVREYVESLQDKIARSVITEKNRSVCDADLTIDTLIEIGEATSENVRLTKDAIGKAFDANWINRIAYAFVLEKSPQGVAALEANAQEFWNSLEGQKFLQHASNYKRFLVRASERTPSFEDASVKEKVMQAIEYLDSDALVDKMKEKLAAAPIASVDTFGL